jgi:pimeloyl-ACP methyl ester carboxylesterase
MVRRSLFWILKLGLVLALCACATPSGSGGRDLTLGAPGQHVEASVYESPALSSQPVLVVVLHGDAPLLRPAYQDEFAASVARHLPDVVAVGLLRPGYADPFGRRSDPQSGPHTGDNYTPEVSEQVTAAIRQLQTQYHPARTILVGHSGGAAIVANIVEAHHDLADAALIVSCPCDLAAWRARMGRFGGRRSHSHSLSPLENAALLPKDTPIIIMVGAKDKTVGVANSQAFFAGAKTVGAKVTLRIAPGSGHMMMGDTAPLQAVGDLIKGRHDSDLAGPQS